MSAAGVASVKLQKRNIAGRFAKPDNHKALAQVLTTLLPFAGLWWLVPRFAASAHPAWIALLTIALSLFLLRSFALMHDCGHGSLFRDSTFNQTFGFVFGVMSGMPQYVWAQHHNYHHITNGNWAKYRGPLAILSVDQYDALSRNGQLAYRHLRNVGLAPFAGFAYLILNPRLNWLRGTAALLGHVVRAKLLQPAMPLRSHAAQFKTRYWETSAEYHHMTLNNLVLLSAWAAMSWLIGPGPFFLVYLLSTSLAGAGGIVLFTVQHNFEHSYASGDVDWDYDVAAIHGTSFLVLPRWLNWFTASIGYHHVHHLCARIPNYRLAECHVQHAGLFGAVKRLTLADIGGSLKFVLWDPRRRRIISIAEHETR